MALIFSQRSWTKCLLVCPHSTKSCSAPSQPSSLCGMKQRRFRGRIKIDTDWERLCGRKIANAANTSQDRLNPDVFLLIHLCAPTRDFRLEGSKNPDTAGSCLSWE